MAPAYARYALAKRRPEDPLKRELPPPLIVQTAAKAVVRPFIAQLPPNTNALWRSLCVPTPAPTDTDQFKALLRTLALQCGTSQSTKILRCVFKLIKDEVERATNQPFVLTVTEVGDERPADWIAPPVEPPPCWDTRSYVATDGIAATKWPAIRTAFCNRMYQVMEQQRTQRRKVLPWSVCDMHWEDLLKQVQAATMSHHALTRLRSWWSCRTTAPRAAPSSPSESSADGVQIVGRTAAVAQGRGSLDASASAVSHQSEGAPEPVPLSAFNALLLSYLTELPALDQALAYDATAPDARVMLEFNYLVAAAYASILCDSVDQQCKTEANAMYGNLLRYCRAKGLASGPNVRPRSLVIDWFVAATGFAENVPRVQQVDRVKHFVQLGRHVRTILHVGAGFLLVILPPEVHSWLRKIPREVGEAFVQALVSTCPWIPWLDDVLTRISSSPSQAAFDENAAAAIERTTKVNSLAYRMVSALRHWGYGDHAARQKCPLAAARSIIHAHASHPLSSLQASFLPAALTSTNTSSTDRSRKDVVLVGTRKRPHPSDGLGTGAASNKRTKTA